MSLCTRRGCYVLTLAVLLSFGATVLAGEEAPKAEAPKAEAAPKPAEGWAITPLLPPETLLVARFQDTKKGLAKLKETGLWRIYAHPDVQRAFRTPLMMAQGAITVAEIQADVKLADAVSFFTQGEITFAVIALDKKTPLNTPWPDMVLSVQVGEKAPTAMVELNKRLDQLKAIAGRDLGVTQTPLGDTTITTFAVPIPEMPGFSAKISYTLCEGNVIFALGEGHVEKLMAARAKFKAGVPKLAEGQAAEVLGQNPVVAKALDKIGLDADFAVFLNVQAVLKNPLLDARPKNEQQRREWDIAGLESIRALSYAAEVKGKGVRETFFIDAPAATRKGLLALIEGEGLPAEALAGAPRNALLAGGITIAPEQLVKKLMDLAAFEDPQAQQKLDAWMAAAGEQLGLDLRKELFNAVSGRVVFSVSVPSRNPKLPVGMPQPIIAVGVKDATAVRNLLKALGNAARESFEISEVIAHDAAIVTWREKFRQGRDPGQFCYVLDQKELLLSVYPLALREELGRRVAQARGGAAPSTLADDPDFKAARANVAGNPQGLLYVDIGALAVAAYDTLLPVAQVAARDRNVDFAALPTSDVLAENMSGAIFGLTADNDGIIASGYSPTGGALLLGAAPIAVLPRMARAQGQRDAAQREQKLNRLAASLKAYAADNNGNLPAALKDLMPKYLPETAGAELAQVVYRGKQDAPNKVVVHTPEQRMGPITILTQDGTVAHVPRDVFGKILNDGYKGEAAPQPRGRPRPDEAVKPPAPPPEF
jgi:hypothetical protein